MALKIYKKTEWVNEKTPLTDTNLNNIENQVELLTNELIDFESKNGEATNEEIKQLKNRAEFYYEII